MYLYKAYILLKFQVVMAYKYDFFISYRRTEPPAKWIGEFFKLEIERQLSSLAFKPKIFFDVETLRNGDVWEEKIKEAIAKSRYFIPIYSPEYFDPEHYAIFEYAYMLEKVKRFGLSNHYNPIRPILHISPKVLNNAPLNYADFTETKDIVLRDSAFEQCRDTLKRKIEEIVMEIIDEFDNIPDYQKEFEDEELFNSSVIHVNELKKIYKFHDRYKDYQPVNIT
jgi:hypothetical protein